MTQAPQRGNQNLGDRVKIVLADDSLTMHRAVRLALKNAPYEIITCDNGQDALRLCLEHRPRVLLADLDMPGMTGPELVMAVKSNPQLINLKVILLCGSFDQVDESRLGKVPADGRIWKPFEAHALSALLKTLLDQPAAISASANVRESHSPTVGLNTQEIKTSKDSRPISNDNLRTAEIALPPLKSPQKESDPLINIRSSQEITSPELEKNLMEETFQVAENAQTQELPIPKKQVPPLPKAPSASELDQTQELLSPPTASRTEAFDNLWSDEFKVEATKPFALQEEKLPEPQAANELSELASDFTTSESVTQESSLVWDPDASPELSTHSDDFEIVTSRLDLNQTLTTKADLGDGSDAFATQELSTSENNVSTASTPLVSEEEWARDQDFRQFEENPSESLTASHQISGIQESQLDESRLGESAGESLDQISDLKMNESQIRELIQEELTSHVKVWLKEMLREELAQVLKEIERD